MTIEQKDIFQYTKQKLESHFQNNENFNKQFTIMYEFYHKKLAWIINESEISFFSEMFFQAVKSQFFNGYFMIREYLALPEGELTDEWLAQPESFLTEEIPNLIRQLVGENFENAITSQDMHQLTIWTVTKYEDVLPILGEIAFDIVCLGAKQAIKDERTNRDIPKYEPSFTSLLAPVEEYTFINPQLYLVSNFINSESEIWTISWWSSLNKIDNKAGEVLIAKAQTEMGEQYILNVSLSREINELDRQPLLENILTRFMENNNIPRYNVAVGFSIVEDYYVLVQE
ncbi:hypothetical protein [Bacillus alkalicellulosilyticus]|uniref:hypothetical protein n=1 Tax=Alkalihalobacterium alkalicellulosilyticum TaxID=1912214 RepID=UPI000998068E|nr:hypothetical protein [Bacillus alkalicellulosilyticus]